MIELVKRHHPTLPVIAMSGDALRLNETSRAGASALLMKPFTEEELMLVAEICLAPGRMGKR